MEVKLVIQHRHVHLSVDDTVALFGTSDLRRARDMGHSGQFLAEQTVDVVGDNGVFERVRVIGPCREHTQVELSASDAFAIGIEAPVRLSGDTRRSGACTLRNGSDHLVSKSTVIIPARHLHCDETTARSLGLQHHDVISLADLSDPDQRLDHVTVRVHPSFSVELHVTADEAAQRWMQTHDRFSICAK